MADPRDDWRTDDFDRLCEAFLVLESGDEVARFLRDLCTFRELNELSSRWRVARMLEEEIPYREISDATGSSTATVTRVNQWRQHGLGGYRIALDRIAAE